jgi:antirestriction protein ArdC
VKFGPGGADVEVKNAEERQAEADAFIQTWGATIKEGPQPMYVPSKDFIFLPAWKDFHGQHEFYATAFHEGIHWTGHKSRLDRDLRNRFGTAEYAAEELIAELGAAFIAAEFGFDVVDNSASYIASWIKLLKEDPKAIFTAASAAQKAVNWLRGKALAEEAPAEEKVLEAA